jgi:hypothetical protein
MLANRLGTSEFGRNATKRGAASKQRRRPDPVFVRRDEFCQLLLSFKKLVRSDEPARHIRGLLDVTSGVRYLIKQEELFTGCH